MSRVGALDEVVLAGDWHGDTGHAQRVIDQAAINRDGTRLVLQLGDFGIWPGRAPARYLDKVAARLALRDAVCLFLDGNHDAVPRLLRYPIGSDGLREVRPRLFHLPRGTRWTWHGVRFRALGGATGLDRPMRTPDRDWWPEETLAPDEIAQAIVGGSCDVMLTHDAPAGVDVPLADPGAEWTDVDLRRADWHRCVLRRVVNEVRPTYLFHGHFHARYDAELRLDDGHRVKVAGLADQRLGLRVMRSKSARESVRPPGDHRW
jgi:hypothetical protein